MTIENKWVSETLLPSLFERFQNRDKKYDSIIVSENVAQFLSGEMEQITTFNEFWGRSFVVGKRAEWRGRTVTLRVRGRYNFVSFGQTQQERDAYAEEAFAAGLKKEIASVQKIVQRGKRVQETLVKYQKQLESVLDHLEMAREDNDHKWIADLEAERAAYETCLKILQEAG